MGYSYLVDDYDQALSPLRQCNNISSNLINDLRLVLYKLHQQKRFSQPMPTIGMYIALASLCCILPMVADIKRSWRDGKMWIPCKYFSLNAVSLTVIAVAVKLPMDLTSPMPGVMDQQAKLGSVAFMCIIMAYLLPSLATMNGKELVTNILALGLLVITLVVNVCIQINTGLVSYSEEMHITGVGGHTIKLGDVFGYANREIAITYVAVLLMLLMIYICSALMILKSKQILESKYQATHERASVVQQQSGQLTVGNLKQRVISYGVMAGTGSPQLMIGFSATSSASAAIGFLICLLHAFKTLNNLLNNRRYKAYDSDYKWSILVIFIIQSIGIAVGAFAMLSRFITPFNFEVSEGMDRFYKFYKVESCWTHTLEYWRFNGLYSSGSPRFNFVVYKLQILVLTILLVSQWAIVITCKAIRVIAFVIATIVFYSLLSALVTGCGCVICLLPRSFIEWCDQPDLDEDVREYVSQYQPEVSRKVPGATLYYMTKSVKRSIKNAEKQQPSKLMKLLEKFRDFEGVKKFDSLPVQSSSNCWSLPVVTLATIALSLRNIQPSTLKNFLNGVSEGLVYVKLVEKSLNNNDELVSVQKAAERLWPEVEVYHKWLGNNLEDPDFRRKTAIQIVEWFNEKARNMVTAVGSKESGGPNDDSICRSICANSMYRLTKTLMLSYQANNDQVSQEDLFAQLSSMISDIVAACLTNLPEVITLKCHTSAIEKREESVHAAAKLLGKTSEILNTLRDRELPSLNPGELPFIDSWRDYLTAPPP